MAEQKPTSPAPTRFGKSQKGDSPNVANSGDQIPETGASPIFRLPKFFSQSSEVADAPADKTADADVPEGSALTPSVAAPSVAPTVTPAAPMPSALPSHELSALRDEIERLTEQITQVNERESSLERVFDTLHAELSDYKNDFLYEHLKPVVRPLLFLFDSIDQFDGEVAITQSEASAPEVVPGTVSADVVRDNVHYFRDQLVEALRVCEVTIMEGPSGAFNPKMHKAVEVVAATSEQDGTIMRVVRSGWFLNGQLLRPAEVAVGKFRAPDAGGSS